MTWVVVVAYAIGSVPFALLLTRRWSAYDLRQIGSGNLGAANVVRVSGVAAGVLVALLDISKGVLSVAIARYFSTQPLTHAAAGLAAIVGHVYPIWLRFRGGKGVATACGVFSMLTPLAIAPALSIFALTVWLTKYISLGSVLASLALPPAAYYAGSPTSVVLAALAAAVLIVFRHRSNLARLTRGRERRFGAGASAEPATPETVDC
jgi:glycerol-3-phosphate acyltransferase PlsY